jgi:hypothetical protein
MGLSWCSKSDPASKVTSISSLQVLGISFDTKTRVVPLLILKLIPSVWDHETKVLTPSWTFSENYFAM